MKKDLKQQLMMMKIKRPNLPARIYFRVWTGSQSRKGKVEYRYHIDKKRLKKEQILMISTHASRNEFFYTMYGLNRTDINIVVGFQNFFKCKSNYYGLKWNGNIPKFLFQPDLLCTRRMLSVLKDGGSLALFPEGIQSVSGSTHPINPATCKFIKKSNVTVVIAHTQGAYLTTPRYSTDFKRGKIIVDYHLLFTKEELKELSEQQIYERLLKAIAYDDFSANKVNRIKYVGKYPNVEGLDKILYRCPQCNGAHTLKVHLDKGNDRLECEKCGYAVTLNEYYDLVVKNGESYFDDVDKWFKWQRRLMHKQVRQQGFELNAKGKLSTLRLDCWKKAPDNRVTVMEGDVKLNADGLTIANEQQTMHFAWDSLYSLTMVTGKFLEFYYRDEYYNLDLDCPTTHLIEWMLASEELHNAQDEKWNSASNDVYGYDN